MRITGAQLLAEAQRALAAWPFIAVYEQQYGLPRHLLLAVGSRETNLTNEVGDGGHGHGVWQLDDRSHTIPAEFDNNVATQCITAAAMLRGLINQYGSDIRAALAAYNAGTGTVSYNQLHGLDVDTGTAGNDYSADVFERLNYLQVHLLAPATPATITPEDDDVKPYIIRDGAAQFWVIAADLSHRIEITPQVAANLAASGQYARNPGFDQTTLHRIPITAKAGRP